MGSLLCGIRVLPSPGAARSRKSATVGPPLRVPARHRAELGLDATDGMHAHRWHPLCLTPGMRNRAKKSRSIWWAGAAVAGAALARWQLARLFTEQPKYELEARLG